MNENNNFANNLTLYHFKLLNNIKTHMVIYCTKKE